MIASPIGTPIAMSVWEMQMVAGFFFVCWERDVDFCMFSIVCFCCYMRCTVFRAACARPSCRYCVATIKHATLITCMSGLLGFFLTFISSLSSESRMLRSNPIFLIRLKKKSTLPSVFIVALCFSRLLT